MPSRSLTTDLALVPKDLFAIEETNATIVDNLVNLDKMRLLYVSHPRISRSELHAHYRHTLLSRVHRWQMISYKTLQPDEQLLAYFKQVRQSCICALRSLSPVLCLRTMHLLSTSFATCPTTHCMRCRRRRSRTASEARYNVITTSAPPCVHRRTEHCGALHCAMLCR